MSNQLYIHVPPGLKDLNELSIDDFISQTKTDGGVKITDLYYRPAAPKNMKEKFLQKLSAFSERISGHWKPAMDSANTEKAMARINSKEYLDKEEIRSAFKNLAIEAAENGGEIARNGGAITLVNVDDLIIIDHVLKKI